MLLKKTPSRNKKFHFSASTCTEKQQQMGRPLDYKLGKAEAPFLLSAPQSLWKRLLLPPFYLPSTL